MRAIVIAAVSGVMALSLASCDNPDTTTPAPQQQAQAVVPPPAPPPCNCQPEHLTRLSYGTHHYRHHYAREWVGERGYHGSYTSQSTKSVDIYGYVSASSVSSYESGGYEGAYGGYESRYGAYDARHRRYYGGQVTWVDGYGRGYFNSAPPTVAATMRGRRLAPWHGYDAYWRN